MTKQAMDKHPEKIKGVKAGNGKYYFELASVNDLLVGPAYSSTHGSLVEGERIQIGMMKGPKGTGAREHSHPNEQWVYIIQGTATMEIDGVKADVGPGTLVYIPANTVHTVFNHEDSVFIVVKDMSYGITGVPVDNTVYGPRFA